MPFRVENISQETTITNEELGVATNTEIPGETTVSIDRVLDDAMVRQVDDEVSNLRGQLAIQEEELIGGQLFMENTDWTGLCERYGTLSVISLNSIPVSPYQLLLADSTTYGSNEIRLIITNPNHVLPRPRITNNLSLIFNIYTRTDNRVNNKGLLIQIDNSGKGMYCYVPFNTGNKTYCLYKKDRHVKMVYTVNTISTDEIIPMHRDIENAISDSAITFRDSHELLTDDDKIIISNSSPKFRRMVCDWFDLGDALAYFDSTITNTVDPAYIKKLMQLSMDISIKRTVPSEETT